MDQTIYHEKQSLWQCGLHAVNNILQLRDKRLTKDQFDEIANQLYENTTKDVMFFNPHKSIFIGNYDANVLMVALQRQGYQADYYNYNKNKKFCSENYPDVQGFIINSVSEFLFTKRKHWIAILKQDQFYYDLDSKHSNVIPKSALEIDLMINNKLDNEGTLLIVRKIQ